MFVTPPGAETRETKEFNNGGQVIELSMQKSELQFIHRLMHVTSEFNLIRASSLKRERAKK